MNDAVCFFEEKICYFRKKVVILPRYSIQYIEQ